MSHCNCKRCEEESSRLAASEKRADILQAELEEIREREAACCPEDIGFDEQIRALEKRAEEQGQYTVELIDEGIIQRSRAIAAENRAQNAEDRVKALIGAIEAAFREGFAYGDHDSPEQVSACWLDSDAYASLESPAQPIEPLRSVTAKGVSVTCSDCHGTGFKEAPCETCRTMGWVKEEVKPIKRWLLQYMDGREDVRSYHPNWSRGMDGLDAVIPMVAAIAPAQPIQPPPGALEAMERLDRGMEAAATAHQHKPGQPMQGIEEVKPGGQGPEYSEANRWWCASCEVYVEGSDVTYQETHDTRSGGCGNSVGTRPNGEAGTAGPPDALDLLADMFSDLGPTLPAVTWSKMREILQSHGRL